MPLLPPSSTFVSADGRRRVQTRFGGALLGGAILFAAAAFLLRLTREGDVAAAAFWIALAMCVVVALPILRALRRASVPVMIGAVSAATGSCPDTTRAMHDVALASGTDLSRLSLFGGEELNAFVWSERRHLNIAVTPGFSKLPRDEQRAGIAMLLGRDRVMGRAFHYARPAGGGDDPPPPADQDVALFSAWLDAAVAGDREALGFLREPEPMICLLERLSMNPSVVGGFPPAHELASISPSFLAWPYFDRSKALAELGGLHDGDRLPPEAAAALSAVIGTELVESDVTVASASIGGSEAIRALRLRDAAGAEGAVAGSTTAAARAGMRERAQQRAAAKQARHAANGPEAGGSERPVSDAPAVAPALAPPVAGAGELASGVRLEVHCPSCGAHNAPTNGACTVCGQPLPPRG